MGKGFNQTKLKKTKAKLRPIRKMSKMKLSSGGF